MENVLLVAPGDMLSHFHFKREKDYLIATLRGRLHNEGNDITIYPDDSTGIKDHPLIYNSDFTLIEDIVDAKYNHVLGAMHNATTMNNLITRVNQLLIKLKEYKVKIDNKID
jgi:hypothetical protein